jgi:hypothetical protein
VQFKSPALGTVTDMSTVKARQRILNLPSALSAIHAEHSQFVTNLRSLDAAFRSKVGGMSASDVTQIRFEYTTALNGVALTTRRWIGEEIQKLPYVSRVSIDAKVQAADDASNVVIGAPKVWSTYSVHGEGIDIGIVDTGIDYLHPALGAAAFPNSKIVGGYDFVNNDADPMDDNGHGTHVAGIAAGDYGTTLRGVAYKARLWAFKVLDARGSGYYSWIVAGIEKAMDPDNDPSTPTPIKVLNFSLGTDQTFSASSPSGDALAQAVNNAVNSGIVCAVAAGNSGPYYAAIGSPGFARNALTVGATTKTDVIADFSSRGPEWYTWGLGTGMKPDVVAPGVDITSAKLGGGLIAHSGTSMATPQVAGAAALLLQLHPEWTPARIKAVLMETAHDIGEDVWTEGGGRISVADAAARTLVIEPPSLDFGMIDVSHPITDTTVTLTFSNLDSRSQTFNLSATYSQWINTPSDVSITFNPTQVTIPAGQSTPVSVRLRVNYSGLSDRSGPPLFMPLLYAARISASNASSPSKVINVPYRFVYSLGFKLIVDETPWWLQDFAIWDFNWPVLNDTIFMYDYLIVWPNNPNIMAGTFFDRKTKILKQISQAPNQTIYLSKGDSKNKITIRCLDEDGQPISLIPGGWAQLVRKKTISLATIGEFSFTLGCGRFFGCAVDTFSHLEELDLPDIDSSWVVSLSYQIYPHNGNLYVFPFTIDGPITSSMTLENDPAKFKRVNYRFDSDKAPNQTLAVGSFDGGQNLGGYWFNATEVDMGISSPYALTAYYLPRPSPNHTWGNYFLDANIPGTTNSRITTAGMNIFPPDTAVFPSYSTAANPLSVKLGFGVPQWTGKTANSSSAINLSTETYSYFVHPLWYYANPSSLNVEPVDYTLSSGSNLVSSGVLGSDWWVISRSTSWSVSAGSYRLQITSSHYKIADTSGRSTASLEIDTRRPDPNPPSITKLQIAANGNLSDEYHRDTSKITFGAGDDVAVDSASVYFQSLGGAVWSQGSLTREGSDYVVGDIPDLPGGYVSMRLRIVDNSQNAVDYKMEPAFLFYPGAPKNPPDLVSPLNGDSDQPAVVSLKWNRAFTARTYHFQFGTDSGLTNLLADDPLLSATVRRVYPLGKGVTYYWRVNAQNPQGASPFSKVCSFTTTTDTTFVMTTHNNGWNLISLPMRVKNRSRSRAFPTGASSAFVFENGAYMIADSLDYGLGYWLKFSPNDTFGVVATGAIASDTIPVYSGWNMIGSVSTAIPVGGVMSEPPGMVASNFFGFEDHYGITDSLKPGKGYWVKLSEDGQLILSAQPARAGTQPYGTGASATPRTIRILATGELPPPPPESESPAPRPAIPREFSLEQNYPNPFNPVTTIRYELPRESKVVIKVYNVLGREVVTLADGDQGPGFKSVSFDATLLSSGVYFYRLEAGRFSDTKKMLIVK